MSHLACQRFHVSAAVAACLMFAAVLGTGRAQAQAEDAARAASARALFDEGVSLADAGQWQDAADRFRRALALRDSAVIAYNLASALQEIGQLVEASELLRRVKNDQAADGELRTSATNALTEVEKRIGRLTVHVQGQQAGDRMLLDARELLAAELDMALPIDPGTHAVRVERDGQSVAEQQVEIAAGQAREVTLQVAVAVPTPREVAVAAQPAAPEQPRTEAEPPITGRWWFWAGAGAIVVGAAVVAVVLAGGGGDEKAEPAAGDFEPAVVGVKVGR